MFHNITNYINCDEAQISYPHLKAGIGAITGTIGSPASICVRSDSIEVTSGTKGAGKYIVSLLKLASDRNTFVTLGAE